MKTYQHTPTPWKITKATNGDTYIGGHEWVLKMVSKVDFTALPVEANAAFIVRACNNYETMLKMLKEVAEVMEGWDDPENEILPYLLQLIQKAER